jgi:ABC-type branched-subunit amino acid transport system substrate-binding protein
VAGCSDDGTGPGRGDLTVYVSLPLSGERSAEARAVANGVRLALAEADESPVRAVFLDDTGRGRRWTLAAAAANAREAAQDSAAVGFIGDLDSGATRASLPITNEAEIVQISPAPAARDLTHRVSEGLTPERYRPAGEQTFVRLYPVGEDLEPCPAAPLRAAVGGRIRGGLATALGYEAMRLLLDAIAAEGDDREDLRDRILSTRDRPSVLGAYSVDDSGDVRLDGGCP